MKDILDYLKGHLIVKDEGLGSHCRLFEKVEHVGKTFPSILLPWYKCSLVLVIMVNSHSSVQIFLMIEMKMMIVKKILYRLEPP